MDLKWPLEESVEKLMLMRPWTRVPTSLSDPQFESVSDALLDESAPHSSTETTSDIEQDTEKETQFWKQYYRVFCLGRSLAEHPVFQADSDRVNPADLRPLVSRVIRNLDCAVMRYLVANDGRVEAAFDAIVSTLHWRRKYQPDRIPYQQYVLSFIFTVDVSLSWVNVASGMKRIRGKCTLTGSTSRADRLSTCETTGIRLARRENIMGDRLSISSLWWNSVYACCSAIRLSARMAAHHISLSFCSICNSIPSQQLLLWYDFCLVSTLYQTHPH